MVHTFRHRGSTLVELILYMAMTTIIVVGLTTVAARIRTAQSSSGGQTEVQQSVRTALIQLAALAQMYETGAVLPDARFPSLSSGLVLWNTTEQVDDAPSTFLHISFDTTLSVTMTQNGEPGETVALTPTQVVLRNASLIAEHADNVPMVSYAFEALTTYTTTKKERVNWSVTSALMLRPTNVPVREICCPSFFKNACSPLIPVCPSSCALGNTDPSCNPPPSIVFRPIPSTSGSNISHPMVDAPVCSNADTGMTRFLLYDRVNDPVDTPDNDTSIQSCGKRGSVYLTLTDTVPTDMKEKRAFTYRLRLNANTDSENRISHLRLDLVTDTDLLAVGPTLTIDGKTEAWQRIERTMDSGSLVVSQTALLESWRGKRAILQVTNMDDGGFLQISAVEMRVTYTTTNDEQKTVTLRPTFPPYKSDAWQAVGRANSLLGFWNFEESNGATALDRNGETNASLLVGSSITNASAWTNGRTTTDVPLQEQGGLSALQFPQFDPLNAAVHMVKIGNGPEFNFTINQSFSFAFWIKPAFVNPADSVSMIVLDKSDSTNVGYSLILHATTNPYFLQFLWGDSTNSIVSAPAAVAPGTWSYVIVSYDATKPVLERTSISINDAPPTTEPGTKRVPSAADPVRMSTTTSLVPLLLGTSANAHLATLRPYQGLIDDVRVYNHPVTLPEVSAGMAPPQSSSSAPSPSL